MGQLRRYSLVLRLSFNTRPASVPRNDDARRTTGTLGIVPYRGETDNRVINRPAICLFVHRFDQVLIYLRDLYLSNAGFVFRFLINAGFRAHRLRLHRLALNDDRCQFSHNRQRTGMTSTIRVRLPSFNGFPTRSIQRDVGRDHRVNFYR